MQETPAADEGLRAGISRRRLFGAAGATAAVVGAAGAGALAGRSGGRRRPARRHAAVGLNPHAPPSDTGEALNLAASELTLTIGFGPSFFEKDGKDRFGVADRRPTPLADLPKFPNETMDLARCGGDICVQGCANHPQVAVHAIRNLARVAFGTPAVRWSRLGFGRTSSTTRGQQTPRNLFGFKDGTRNIKAEDTARLNRHVWVAADDGPEWLTGGTYLVARRIRMRIESWDRTTLLEQERVIGRQKGSGAPNGYADEFAELDLRGEGARGKPLIDVDAHVRLASAEELGGIEILRRGYNFTDGSDGFGHLDCRPVLHRVRPQPDNSIRADAGAAGQQ
jgi:deferrochelatase/peroxidase EfeB